MQKKSNKKNLHFLLKNQQRKLLAEKETILKIEDKTLFLF